MTSRISDLERSGNIALGTIMPSVQMSRGKNAATNVVPPSPCPSSVSDSPTLLELAEQGNSDAICQFLVEEKDYARHMHLRTKDGNTALHVVASRGYLKATGVLLGWATEVDTLGNNLRTPLHCAAYNGHPLVTQLLLDRGAQIDAKDASGSTALELAIQRGHSSVVDLFLEKGESADLRNAQGHTLLVLAAKAQKTNIVELLLKRGASATRCKKADECALRYAAEGGEADAVRLILRHGAASVPEQVQRGLQNMRSAAVVWAFFDVLPDAMRGELGMQSYWAAANDGRFEPLVALLDTGISINARNARGRTALHFAAQNEDVAFLKVILQRGADINAKDNDGDTPLHLAYMYGEMESVRALIEAGASTTVKNNNLQTPSDVSMFNNFEIVTDKALE